MSTIQTGASTIERGDPLASIIGGRPRSRTRRPGSSDCAGQPLSCVWSDTTGGCSCHSRIPQAVVENAWRLELDAGERKDRFFHFIWRDGVWLAFGLKDGRVRGVYCPSHNSERAERSH